MNKIIVIIPAYNPNKELIKIVKSINNQKNKEIIIINDGSKKEKEEIFEKITNKSTILTNNTNKGKGYSLKKAITWVWENKQDIIGIITADADGQHSIKDINKIAEKLEENNKNNDEKIILGTRNFNQKKIPLKNKMGNIINSYLLKKKTKVKIKDTQTGLRGLPLKYLSRLKSLEGNRYEYEQNMLLYMIKEKIPFEEIDIETIYNKNNKSHFNTINDTYKIIKTYKSF